MRGFRVLWSRVYINTFLPKSTVSLEKIPTNRYTSLSRFHMGKIAPVSKFTQTSLKIQTKGTVAVNGYGFANGSAVVWLRFLVFLRFEYGFARY
jgi:hypothetical protein